MKTPNWFLNKSIIAYLLVPLSVVYYLTARAVYLLRTLSQKTSKRPVICIGNLFAGGVGKTPIVREVAKFFDAPIVMRGYKSKNGDDGDEAKMLAKSGLNVCIGNRLENVIKLNNEKSISPIVFDDGFQNPTVKKDISVLVFDNSLGFGNGFVLPAGPLREPVSAIQRADAVVVIKKMGAESNAAIGAKLKKYKKTVFYATNETINPASGKYIAFAGIGYPDKFFDALKSPVLCVPFPDHYQYTNKDLDRLFKMAVSQNAELVTTEKDWVRLPKSAQKKIHFAKLNTKIENSFFNWLKDKLNENI